MSEVGCSPAQRTDRSELHESEEHRHKRTTALVRFEVGRHNGGNGHPVSQLVIGDSRSGWIRRRVPLPHVVELRRHRWSVELGTMHDTDGHTWVLGCGLGPQ